VSRAPLVEPEIQAQLISEALLGATVGLLVWDEERRYIAANDAACEILGTSLDDLLGQLVGDHTHGGIEAAEEAIGKGLVTGEAIVERFDGSGHIRVFYATFETRTAGMPFMATLLARREMLPNSRRR
jgi:PAS domain-containing protein